LKFLTQSRLSARQPPLISSIADKPPGEAQGGVLKARPEGPKRADKAPKAPC
jgi:hypothetical protein